MTEQYGGWRKSRHSQPNGDCVEAARSTAGAIGVRDSKADGNGPILRFTRVEWTRFTRRLRL